MPDSFVDNLVELGQQVDQLGKIDSYPNTLYHFTDSIGLAGILTTKELWISRGQSLNDASEVEHGLSIARNYLNQAGCADNKYFFRRILECLDGKALRPDYNVNIEPFVVSFCSKTDYALQWLHYGRSGTGYAIGFSISDVIRGTNYPIYRLVYDTQSQERMVVDAINKFAGLLNSNLPHNIIEAAAVACAASLRSLASRMKHPSFASEDEWRILVYSISGDHVNTDTDSPPQPIVRYLSANNRIIPYIVRKFKRLPINEIILGFSATESEENILSVLKNADCEAASVHRSTVPVRL